MKLKSGASQGLQQSLALYSKPNLRKISDLIGQSDNPGSYPHEQRHAPGLTLQ